MIFAVVGSRSFNDYKMLKRVLDEYKNEITGIVSGQAAGADSLAAKYAKENNIPLTEFVPDWKKWGKRAGFLRNKLIVDASDCLIAFIINNSKGSSHSVELAHKKGIPCKVFVFNQ